LNSSELAWGSRETGWTGAGGGLFPRSVEKGEGESSVKTVPTRLRLRPGKTRRYRHDLTAACKLVHIILLLYLSLLHVTCKLAVLLALECASGQGPETAAARR